MGAPKGNQFAKGNKGGGQATGDRTKVSRFKGFVLDWLIEKMEHGTEPEKKEIVMKLGSNCIPRDVDVTSGGKPIIIPAELIAKHDLNGSAEEHSDGPPSV